MDDLELLFFDTFSHEASEEINLDLVQFPKPVFIGEVRIIPLGARVQADFPGGVRLGATNPSQFKIEFFVNDLSKPGASTFENLGIMDYNQNGNIHLECEQKVATDGLVLRGWYTTITLAIYGALTKTTEPQDTGNSQPQGQPAWTQNQAREDKFEGSHYASYPAESFPQNYPRYPWQAPAHHSNQGCVGEYEATKTNFEGQEGWESREDSKQWIKDKPEQPFRQMSPSSEYRERGTPEFDNRQRDTVPAKRPPSPPTPPTKGDDSGGQLSPGDVESISEGDIPEEDQPQTFEPLSDDELPEYTQDMEYDVTELTEPVVKMFDPYTFEVHQLKWFKNPGEGWVGYKNTKSGRLLDLLSSLGCLSHNRQGWIEVTDEILSLLPAHITDRGVEEKLMEVVLDGLDWQMGDEEIKGGVGGRVKTKASDEEPVLKVRRLKVGLRLAEVSVASPRIAAELVIKHGIHHILFNLYHMEWMALSLKLLMLRVVDVLLCYQPCLKHFLSPPDDSTSQSDDTQSGYQRLISMLHTPKTHARLKFSVTSLITKIHFYQLLDNLRNMVKKLEDKNEVDMSVLDLCLEEIHRLYKEAPRLICQPKRFLPVSALFEDPKSHSDPRLQLYAYFTYTDFVKTLSNLLSNSETSSNPSVVAPIYSLISEMSLLNHGLRYLFFCKGTNKLLRTLESSNLTLAYKLKTLSILDELGSCFDIDRTHTIDNLHLLTSLTINEHVGKGPILQVLTYEENISILINCLMQKSVYKKKSPSRGYITDLIVSVVKSCSNIEYLKKYASKIADLSKGEFSELKDAMDWLKPCLIPTAFSYDNISSMYDYVKNNVDNCTNLPGELITAVRILKYLGIPSYERDRVAIKAQGDYRELKYKYVILQIYSLDGLSDFTNILNKLCDKYDPVFGGFPSGRRSEVATLVLPVVELMRRLLSEVINARGSEFKDMTAVRALLGAYQLLSSTSGAEASCGRHEITQALLAYTQAFDPALPAKSAWSLMATEVVNWAGEAPRQISTGLSVLSELLPLPLPLVTPRQLSEEESSSCIASRRAWAAVLAPAPLPSLISALAHTAHRPTAQAAHTLALRYADLAAPSALSLVRALIETPTSSRSASFLSSLASHPPIKAALLQVLEVETWSQLLTEQIDALLPAIQALCDCEISLIQASASSTSVLASSLPPTRILAVTLSFLTRLASSSSIPKHSLLPILRTFCLLAEHDYGLFLLHKYLEVESGWCQPLVESGDNEVVGWVVGLGLALGSPHGFPLRNQSLNSTTLRPLFKYSLQQQHSLHDILKRESSGDESVEPLKKNVESLLKLLDAETVQEANSELTEPVLDEAEPILAQFSSRQVFVVLEGADSESLSPSFWMSPPLHYQGNSKDDQNQSAIDLSEIAKTDLKGWDLSESLSELCSKQNTLPTSESAIPKPAPSPNKPAFVGGSRGGRGGTGGTDVFRSRAANTSRPPSLHVDDFVALETCGAQPTGPTGYNKLSMIAAQDILGMRGQPAMRGGGRQPPLERNPRFFNQSYLPQHHFPYYHPHF